MGGSFIYSIFIQGDNLVYDSANCGDCVVVRGFDFSGIDCAKKELDKRRELAYNLTGSRQLRRISGFSI